MSGPGPARPRVPDRRGREDSRRPGLRSGAGSAFTSGVGSADSRGAPRLAVLLAARLAPGVVGARDGVGGLVGPAEALYADCGRRAAAAGGWRARAAGGAVIVVLPEVEAALDLALELRAADRAVALELGQLAEVDTGGAPDVLGPAVERVEALARWAPAGQLVATGAFVEGSRGWWAPERGRFTSHGRAPIGGAASEATPVWRFVTGPDAAASTEEVAPFEGLWLRIGERRHGFDARQDRRVIIGRASGCDLAVRSGTVSRKHAMLLADGPGWWLHDLGSSSGTRLDGKLVRAPVLVQAGQTIFVGAVAVTVERAVLPGAAGGGPRLRVDLGAGLATFGEVALPLSASELVWLAHLAAARRRGDGEGWVLAGRDGHAALRAFVAPLRSRPWFERVRTRPLLELVDGLEVDDDDLRSWRAKVGQRLRAWLGEAPPGALALVPETDGRGGQRLPLDPAHIDLVG